MSEETSQVFVGKQLDAFGGFLTDLERYCGVKSKAFSVADQWKSKRPSGIKLSLEDYLATVRTFETFLVDRGADGIQDSGAYPTS